MSNYPAQSSDLSVAEQLHTRGENYFSRETEHSLPFGIHLDNMNLGTIIAQLNLSKDGEEMDIPFISGRREYHLTKREISGKEYEKSGKAFVLSRGGETIFFSHSLELFAVALEILSGAYSRNITAQ